MFKNIVPVTREAHQDKKIKKVDSFAFAANFHLASIMVHEFARAASMYPIVFVEDQESEEFRPVVLLGLEAQENLFVNDEGKWEASFIPAIIRRYPFALARTKEENRFTVCLDEQSELVSDEEGEPMFQEDGTPSKVLERVKQYLGELQQMEQVTKQFCQTLKDKYMFTPLNMRFRDTDTVKNISGAYVIHEQRLNNLSDEDFLSIRHQNLLAAIYSHLTSLAQVERLIQLREKRTESEVSRKKVKSKKS